MTMDCEKTVESIVEFIKEEVGKARAKGVVLGISGGIDSALVGKLCVMALGDDNVQGLFLPADKDVNSDSRLVAKYLHIYANAIPIGDACQKIAMLTGAFDPVPLGNIKARMRMVVLYAHANKNNMLVAGTSNKSEMLTGYFTKYGDGGCDIEPIGDLYKTDVWTLAKHLALPPSIIEKVPSAELWAGQTDEKELGVSYPKLDIILKLIAAGAINATYIASKAEVTEKVADDILCLYGRTMHKRKMPPIARKGY